jgi:hypothetical protein
MPSMNYTVVMSWGACGRGARKAVLFSWFCRTKADTDSYVLTGIELCNSNARLSQLRR